MNRVWTEEELDILRRDRAAKVPIPVTAAKLGRPVPATYARARLIGTLVQPHQPWDEASIARLRELVSADPPMTDRRIAEELERTVTQIRWKMHDLKLIGTRDLSKLAKLTAAEMPRRKAAKAPSERSVPPTKPVPQKMKPPEPTPAPTSAADPVLRTPAVRTTSPPTDLRAALERTLKHLEVALAERLRKLVSETESGLVQAAMDAIAEKRRIDERLADLGRRIADGRADNAVKAERTKATVKTVEVSASIKDQADDIASSSGKKGGSSEELQGLSPKPAAQKATVPAVHGVSKAADPCQKPSSTRSPTPKIVVVETPVAARPEPSTNSDPVQVSGRGGWKSIRRDPARVVAKAKGKAASRADAVDLAQAAQAAIDRFIAERGVTRTERNGIQTLVARLQARGYIVVQDGNGWVIDQRHRVDGPSALVAFAQARGISDMAA